MKQWINTRSAFQMVVTFVVPKTGPIHLVLVGLMAGRQSGRQMKALLFQTLFKSYNSTSNALSDFFRLLLIVPIV